MRSDWGKGHWEVFVRDKYTCRYCGLSISTLNQIGYVDRWDLFCADHVKASKGDSSLDTFMNLVTACLGCNAKKGSTFDRQYDGPAPITLEEQEALVQQANEYIRAEREKWAPDVKQMQRDAAL